jgi:hypothetical protein
MAKPTRDDAQLMVQLARWGTELGLQDALPVLFAEDFDPEKVDMLQNEAVRTVLYYGESVGTLVKHDLLSRELLEDWLWVEGMWAKVGPAALRQRAKVGEPRLFENFEALASRPQ